MTDLALKKTHLFFLKFTAHKLHLFESQLQSYQGVCILCFAELIKEPKHHTCSATKRRPLSGRSHSYVSPRMGLKGFPPVLQQLDAYPDTTKVAIQIYRNRNQINYKCIGVTIMPQRIYPMNIAYSLLVTISIGSKLKPDPIILLYILKLKVDKFLLLV